MHKIINCEELNDLIKKRKKVIIRVVTKFNYLAQISEVLTSRIVSEKLTGYGMMEKEEFEKYLKNNRLNVSLFGDIYLLEQNMKVKCLPYFCRYERMLSLISE